MSDIKWKEVVSDSRIELFPNDEIFVYGEFYTVLETKTSTNQVSYKLCSATGSAFEITAEELKKHGYRRVE